MKKLYTMFWDCGRMGDIEGVFVADEDALNSIIGKQVYFGEVLGKHSEIYGTLEESDLKVMSDDQDFIEKLVDVFGGPDISGFNPFHYIDEDDDDLEEA